MSKSSGLTLPKLQTAQNMLLFPVPEQDESPISNSSSTFLIPSHEVRCSMSTSSRRQSSSTGPTSEKSSCVYASSEQTDQNMNKSPSPPPQPTKRSLPQQRRTIRFQLDSMPPASPHHHNTSTAVIISEKPNSATSSSASSTASAADSTTSTASARRVRARAAGKTTLKVATTIVGGVFGCVCFVLYKACVMDGGGAVGGGRSAVRTHHHHHDDNKLHARPVAKPRVVVYEHELEKDLRWLNASSAVVYSKKPLTTTTTTTTTTTAATPRPATASIPSNVRTARSHRAQKSSAEVNPTDYTGNATKSARKVQFR